jgi:hypothetical protein
MGICRIKILTIHLRHYFRAICFQAASTTDVRVKLELSRKLLADGEWSFMGVTNDTNAGPDYFGWDTLLASVDFRYISCIS